PLPQDGPPEKVALVTGGIVAAALVLGTALSIWQAVRATIAERAARASEEAAYDQKREADNARETAETQRDELTALNSTLRRTRYVADMNLAHHAWAENNLIRTWQLLEDHRPKPGETDLRGFEWHYLRRLFHGELQVVKAHDGPVLTVKFTSDGKRLISFGRSEARRDSNTYQGVPSEIKLWDAATGLRLPLRLKGSTDNASGAALSPDRTRLAAARGDEGVRARS